MSRRRVAATLKCRGGRRVPALVVALAVLGLALPAAAHADVASVPVATSYLARITHLPAGLKAKIVDGYQQLWLQAPRGESVVVLDYFGAPWVRFGRAGVSVNKNSQMYYLSQTPVPAVPPPGLTRRTPPHWIEVSAGRAYMWREGRLHGLTTIELAPGTSYVGPWSIPVLIDGRLTRISGGLWYAGDPSIVWFWPIIVLIACVLAAWRVRRPALDDRLARTLSLTLLGGLGVAAVARELHGRPSVTAVQAALLVVAGILLAAAAARLLSRRGGYLLMLAIAFVSLWGGLVIFPTLLHGYVLLAVPAFLARADTVLLLGGGLSLILLALRVLEQGRAARPGGRRSAAVVT